MDSFFKQSFEGVSSNVPPGVWEGVAASTTGAAAGAAGTSVLAKLAGVKGVAILGGAAVVVSSIYYLAKPPKTEVSKSVTPAIENVISSNTEVVEESTRNDKSVVPIHKVETQKSNELTSSSTSTKTNNADTQSGITEGKSDINTHNTVNDNNSNNNSIGQPEKTISQLTEQNQNIQVTIESNRTTGCVNTPIDFVLKSNTQIANATWLLNGKVVSSNISFARLLFDNESEQVLEVIGNGHTGEKFKARKVITIAKANAGFTTKQINEDVIATSSSIGVVHQWFVNNVMVSEGKATLTYRTDEKQIRIAHVMKDRNGCLDSVSQLVELSKKEPCELKTPIYDVITPYYKDGLNDEFIIPLSQVEEYRLTIYNVLDGNIVFDTKSQEVNWNGQINNDGPLVPKGIYIYRLVYMCNGQMIKKQDKIRVTDQEK